MTYEQAKAVLCIWGYAGHITRAMKALRYEVEEYMNRLLADPVCTRADEAAVTRARGFGDSSAYKVGSAERLERALRKLDEVARRFMEMISMTNACAPDDPALRRALRMHVRTRASWKTVSEKCGVDAAQALEAERGVLRRLIRQPWTRRESAAVFFARKLMPSRALARPREGLGANRKIQRLSTRVFSDER